MRATTFAVSVLGGLSLMRAAAAVEYSADYIMESAAGAVRGHIYSAPGVERREDVMDGGATMVTIRRDDKKALWMLMPSERMYMEIKAGQPSAGPPRAPSPEEYQTQMTTEGREEVAGVMTTKSKVIMTAADGSKMGGFWWTTDDGIVVKMDVLSVDKGEKLRMKRELSNIQVGAQQPDLFEIPADYTTMQTGIGAGLLGQRPSRDEVREVEPANSDEQSSEESPKKKKFGIGGALRGVLGGR